MKTNYEMHKVRVENVCFTRDGRYLISLGGRDDGFIVVWDIENESPFCGNFLLLIFYLSFFYYPLLVTTWVSHKPTCKKLYIPF